MTTFMTEIAAKDLLAGALTNEGFAAEYEKQRVRRVLSDALFRLRKNLGLTQTTLAQRVGWSQPYVARLEGNPSAAVAAMERIEKFANACGASTMVVFVDEKTGAIKESISIGAKQSLQELASHLVGAPATTLGAGVDSHRLDELNAAVMAVEEIGAATERLRSQLEVFQGEEVHASMAR